jgi:hypothetical protein
MPKKIEWVLMCGELTKTAKASVDELPVEIATKIIEKNFKKMFKSNKKTVKIDLFAVLKNEYISITFPTSVLFANAGFYNHAELLHKHLQNNIDSMTKRKKS